MFADTALDWELVRVTMAICEIGILLTSTFVDTTLEVMSFA